MSHRILTAAVFSMACACVYKPRVLTICTDEDDDGVCAADDCDDSAATGAICHFACGTFYADHDRDGYGNSTTAMAACAIRIDTVIEGNDCDDSDDTVNPGATETCDDSIDQDCNGFDLMCGCADGDNDTYYAQTCGGSDCDDTDPNVHPRAVESCADTMDNDCNGAVDDTDSVCQSTKVADPQGSLVIAGNGYLSLGPVNVYYGYFGEDANGARNKGGIVMAPKNESAASCIACDTGQPREITTDSASVYWVDISVGELRKAPLGGGPVITLWTGQVGTPVAVDQHHVYWFDASSDNVMLADHDGHNAALVAASQAGVESIAADGLFVYWTSQGNIIAKDLSGSNPIALARGQTNPKSIAVDATHVYWAEGDWNAPLKSVRRIAKGGGTVEQLATFGGAWAIALDATHVYTAGSGPNTADNTIWRVPKTGGTIEILAVEQPYPFDIEVDDVAVYWSSESDGGVDMVLK